MVDTTKKMIDLTDTITGSDIHMKMSGSKITRLSMLLNKLNVMKKKLDEKKPIITEVWENGDFVERTKGTFKDTEEILEYYSKNFVIRLTMKENKNLILINLDKPIPKGMGVEEE